MDIKSWYARTTKLVNQSGQVVNTIRLMAANQVWHIWDGSLKWADPDDWDTETQTVLSELAEQWAAKKWPVVLVAEDKSGQIVSQCPFELMGRNKSLQSMNGAGDTPRAYVDAMNTLQGTWERTLTVVNEQMSIQTKQLQVQGAQFIELMSYVREAEHYRATEPSRLAEATEGAQKDPLRDQLAEALPTLLELAGKFIESRAKPVAAAATVPLKSVS